MKIITDKKRVHVLIVGGGVAGASLAIRLARFGLAVLVAEKERFPRHKLCGEFVSPECLSHFRKLGILESINGIEGDLIRETRFYSTSGNSVRVPSKWFTNGQSGALGISRAEMDFLMLDAARNSGAEIYEEHAACRLDVQNKRVTGVTLKDKAGGITKIEADLIVDATGRARVLGKLLDRKLGTSPPKSKIGHVAFKAHFENVRLENGVCEIYFFRGGYGGLNYVENGAANNCFLIDSGVVREFRGNADRILREVVFKNKRAYQALRHSRRKFDWLAVPVPRFGKQASNEVENLTSIGDSGAFIDPFTGSGMLMALESSEVLAEAIRSNLPALESKRPELIKYAYESRQGKIVKRRLRVCSILHRFSFSPNLANLLILAAGLNNRFLERFTSLTRPA